MNELVALKPAIRKLRWFHQIDFGNGVLTPGVIKQSKIRRMSRMLFNGLDLRGRTLLDIGCWDGAYSLEATRRGAAVTATDHFVWHGSWGDRRCIDLVQQHLAPSMQIVDADLPDLSAERVGRFDVVLFLGVLYHLRDPLTALERVADLTTDTLIVETRMTMRHIRKPVMQFHPGMTLGNDPTNWWTPNRRCVEAMLHELGFQQVRFTQPDWLWRRGMFHASGRR
jgi:tRNA (mo5U34)-methyltransferase